MLQMNNIELNEFLDEQLEQNPLLEKALPENEAADKEAELPEQQKDEIEAEFANGWDEDKPEPAKLSDFDAGTVQAGAGGAYAFDISEESFESRMSKEKTLREHLMDQMEVAFNNPVDRRIAGLLIDQINEIGYFTGEVDKIATQLGLAAARIEGVLRTMKGLEPTGIFAADLSECLALQLEEKKSLDAQMRILLEHLDLLAAHDYKKLAELCRVNDVYLRDMVAEIRALNPRPASAFDHAIAQTAIPDILMKRLPAHLGGGWRVELNADTLPRVLVNQTYYTEVLQHASQKKDKEYLSTQLSAANWLTRALDQRAQTILKTAAAIVEEQDAFFNYGIEYLKPITLKDIAEAIQMHESTVSRVTTNKYIGTPRGIFELKFFFTTALGGEAGASHSAKSVKAKIKAMIDAETAEDVLSDDTIMDRLKAEGIDIARRTVAKYREGMNIPSSVQRRRKKKNQGA